MNEHRGTPWLGAIIAIGIAAAAWYFLIGHELIATPIPGS